MDSSLFKQINRAVAHIFTLSGLPWQQKRTNSTLWIWNCFPNVTFQTYQFISWL